MTVTPPEPLDAGDELADPIPGTVVATDAVIPSPASTNAAADRARGRTTVQVGIPTAVVVVGSWLARLAHIDLDPGAGADLPADVAGAFVAILTVVLAFRMNPKTKR